MEVSTLIRTANNTKAYSLIKTLNTTRYNASEGFFAIQDLNNSNDLLLMLDYGFSMNSFLWILLAQPNKVLRLDVELHKNYAIVITTNSGLWRYLIGDTVRFTSLNLLK
jgi:hypothetical protein